MRRAACLPSVLALALAGCTATLPAQAPGPVPSAAAAPPLALAAPSADVRESLPFRTLIADDGPGTWLLAGPDARTVLRSAADLEALLARYQRWTPEPQVPGRPVPGASFGPPMMAPPPGAPTPDPNPQPFPEPLMKLDWSLYQAIAFVDGAVDVSATSRITGLVDLGDKLEVRTTRWVAPPNPGSGPSRASRLHVIAIPRGEQPISWAATAEVDGTSKDGGGYGVGGGPTMSPRWKAIPNPLQTREMVEVAFASEARGEGVKRTIEKRTMAWVRANMGVGLDAYRYTPDSEVWVATAEGDLESSFPGGGPSPGIGGTPDRLSQVIALYSIETDFPMLFTKTGKAGKPGVPGFGLQIDHERSDLRLGGTLRIATSGQPPEGAARLTLTPGDGAPVVKEIPYKDLANFELAIDRDAIPGLKDVAVQTLAIQLAFGGASTGTEVKLLRDPDVLPAPPMAVQGPGLAEEYKPRAGEQAWDAMVRRIAEEDWKGQDLKTTSTDSTFAAWNAKGATRFLIAADTPVKVYEIRGTFPKFLVNDQQSGKGVDEVLVPKRLVIAATAELPVVVLKQEAFAD